MPSTRVVITIIAGVAALIAYFATKGSHATGSSWPLGYAMIAFAVVYTLGNIGMGVVQGMREAQRSGTGTPGAAGGTSPEQRPKG
jgi:hypothetical protein